MNKAIVTIAVLIVAATIAVSPLEAQTGINIQATEANYSFGQHITFHLQASAPATITEINLFFHIQGQHGNIPVPISFEPGSQVSIDHVYSMAQSISPFATITYWWTVHDEAGHEAYSEKKLLYYADNRYDWQRVTDEQQSITWEVYWVEGDIVFGQTALNIAVEALDEIYYELRTPVPGFVRIYIYPSEGDLRSALNLGGYDWAGGQARPDLGVILIGVPDGPLATNEMGRLIPHELTHLLVYEAVGQKSRRVPPWLDEGLACAHELHPDPDRKTLLEQSQDHLIPLEALCAPFPLDESTARLAYAQSESVVLYLREKYGSQAIRDLLAQYADNASCEAGVTRALGTSLTRLDSAWRAYLANQGEIVVALNDSAVWLALWLLTALLALPLVGALRT